VWLSTKLNKNNMAKKLTTKNCIIACQEGRIYSSPAHIPHIASCDIPCSVDVGVDGMSTSLTLKEPRMSDSISVVTSITFFRCVSRINIDNSDSLSKSLIFNKVLKLSKSPLVNPLIVSSGDSNSTQIFHNNNISFFEGGNNRSTNVMVCPSHKPFPSSGKFLQLLSGTSCAFGLEFANKSVSFFPQGFNFVTIKNIPGSDCKIINPQVHPKNFGMLVRSFGIFLGECKSEISFIIGLGEQTLDDIPIFKIMQSVFGDSNRNFNSSINCRDTQNIIFKRETSWSIISDRSVFNQGFSFGFLQNPTSHFNTRSRKLSRKSEISQFRIDKRVKFNIVFNSQIPTIFNTILKSLFVKVNSIHHNFVNFNLNRNTSNQHHQDIKGSDYLNLSKLNSAIPPTDESMGLLASNNFR